MLTATAQSMYKKSISKRSYIFIFLTLLFLAGLIVSINNPWDVPRPMVVGQHIIVTMLALFIWNVAFIRHYAFKDRFDRVLGYAYLFVFIALIVQVIGFSYGHKMLAEWADVIEHLLLGIMLLFLFPVNRPGKGLIKHIKQERIVLVSFVIIIAAVIAGIIANNVKRDTHSEIIELLNFAALVITLMAFIRLWRKNRNNHEKLISYLLISVALLLMCVFVYAIYSGGYNSNRFYAEMFKVASFAVLAYGLLRNVLEVYKYQARARLVLISKNKELAEIDRQKDEFVGFVSHQLKTPLTAIKWRLDFMKDNKNNSVQQIEDINAIDKSNQRLIDLVNMFLNLTRLNLNKYKPVIEKFRPYDVIHNIIDDNQQSIKLKNLNVIIECRHDQFVEFDKTAFGSIADNLMTNAFKYCRQDGKIQISCSITVAEIIFSVSDNGIGIPVGMQQNLFKPFSRLGNINKTKISGSGYGLYFVHKLTTSLGGIISFESQADIGSTFTVKLPINIMYKQTE